MGSRQSTEKTGQIDALDGLRGMAALIVFISHTSQLNLHLIPGVSLFGIGKYGVFLFFVLSAFLLTLPFVRKGPSSFERDALINYGLRRFFRIYPLFFAYILAGLVSTILLARLMPSGGRLGIPFALSPREFADHLLLQKGFGVTWSILVEFRYYFLLPLVAWVFSVLLKGRLLPCLAVGGVAIGVASWLFPPVDKQEFGYSLPEYLPLFFAGSTLAVLHRAWEDSEWSSRAGLRLALDLGAMIGGVIVLSLTPALWGFLVGAQLEHKVFHKHYFLWALLWGVVLMATLHGRGVVRRFFENRFLRYLGSISFSVYLIHIVVLTWAAKKAGNVPAIGWICFAITLVLSHLSWKWIEVPSSRVRWSPRKTSVREPSTRSV